MFSVRTIENSLFFGQPIITFAKQFVKFQYVRTAYNQFLTAQFSTVNHVLNAKVHVDRENQFAHDILSKSVKAYKIFDLNSKVRLPTFNKLPICILEPPKTAQEIEGHALLRDFSTLTRFCVHMKTPIKEPRFKPMTDLFCKACHKLSDEQLVTALREVAPMTALVDSVKDDNFINIWNALDIECCNRIEKWDTDHLLLVCDAWYSLNLSRICQFVWEALRKMGRKIKRMKPEQLVQCMFYCNLVRKPLYEMFEFEVNMAKNAKAMTLTELGIMSMGFFKTQTPIRNSELLVYIAQRLNDEIATVEDITLVSILKILRYSCKLPQIDAVMQLLDSLSGQIHRFSLISCLHIALLGTDLQCCNDQVIELVLNRFNNEIDSARLKDLERICLVNSLYNYKSPTGIDNELGNKILAVLEDRIEEILKHPKSFALCLHFLSLRDLYNQEMISSVLEPNFIKHTYNKNPVISREIFHLDSYTKINLQDGLYKGNYLTGKNRKTMAKVLCNYLPERNEKSKMNTTDRILVEIKETSDQIFKVPLDFKHVLPHFERPDIVICYDRRKRRALKISAKCPPDYSGEILTRDLLLTEPLNNYHDTIVIVIAGWNNVVRNKDRHTGLFDMKLTQLALLGHKPLVVYWHEWLEMETAIDRLNLMKRRISALTKL